MGGEYREIKIVATVADTQHWHPGWLRAAVAEGPDSDSCTDWLVRDLVTAVRKAVDAWAKTHPDELACEPDVIG